jgi:hypothetical protein
MTYLIDKTRNRSNLFPLETFSRPFIECAAG